MLTREGIVEQLKMKYCRYRYEALDANPDTDAQTYNAAVWKRNEIAKILESFGVDVVRHYDINPMPPKEEVQNA